MNFILNLFGGNLSLSIIFVATGLLILVYVITKPTTAKNDTKTDGVMSFDAWYALMSFVFLSLVVSFCVCVLQLS